MDTLTDCSQTIYSVSALNAEVKQLMTEHFGIIWVMGEISNLSKPSSGHVYFSLKDQTAQIRCALFRFQHQNLPFSLENGQQVIVQAQVSVYEARGDYQLIVSTIQLAGEGKLQVEFEKLKKKLEQAGLFDDQHKKPIPELPKQIGIITSSSGAALQDILKVLNKRFSAISVIVYPTLVQGEKAAKNIAETIQWANQRKDCDVLILARGGGSLEDLWPFNEEIVARAIFDSHIPIITGIGHQTDFTIADFVADFRAATPSAAAECAVPDHHAYQKHLKQLWSRLKQWINSELKTHQTHLLHLQKRLQHPRERLKQQAQQIDQLEMHLERIMRFIIHDKKQSLAVVSQTLDALSPLKTLHRGFSITKHSLSETIITKIDDVKLGDVIITRVTNGEIESTVVRETVLD